MAWITECQIRKEKRILQVAVAIQYAKMAMGGTARGLFVTTREFEAWEEFMQALKPKFLLHTAEYQLLVETHSWKMTGDCPRFHAIIQTSKLFISEDFHGTIVINILKARNHYFQRKVIKEPKPATLDEAIQRTLRVFNTAQPPVPQPQVPHAVATSYAQAVAPLAHVSTSAPPTIDIDAMR